MLSTIIALLIALGAINSQTDFDNLSQQEQEQLTQIVVEDNILQ